MENLTIMQSINSASFLLASIIIAVSGLYYTLRRARSNRLHSKIFLLIIIDILASACAEAVNALILPYVQAHVVLQILQEINSFIYFLFHSLLGSLFCFYTAIITNSIYRLKRKNKYIFEIPIFIMIALVLINPLTHWIYYYDVQRVFTRSWGEYLIYIFNLGYAFLAVYLAMRYWTTFAPRKQRILLYFFGMVSSGVILQLLIPALHIELFMEICAMIGIMVTLENDDSRRDSRTGLFNQGALASDIQTLLESEQPFSIICLKMINPQRLMQQIGPANIEKLTTITAGYLNSLVPWENLYYLNPGTFTILIQNKPSDQNMHIANIIYERFQHEWDFLDHKFLFHAAIFYAEVPQDLQQLEPILGLIMSRLPDNIDSKSGVYNGKDLNFLLRRSLIERALSQGLEHHAFEVFYQPIYDAKDQLICAGEALLRLHDPIIGEVYPNEFLPLAEQSGIIIRLGDFVLEEACKFLNSGIPVEMGVETININLSTVQCLQPGQAHRIIEIVKRYSIDPSHINFEITESTAATDFEALSSFIQILKTQGFKFTVDDYGIGYSNVHSIFSLNVDMIKIDRSILWEAEESGIGRIIMESSTEMIKRMQRKILIAGVETDSQVALAKSFDVDYLQGFYFSNAITQNEFISILKATKIARVEEERAVAANEAMSNFLANMNHEIRTPINAILGLDEMIIRVNENEHIQEYARIIQGAGKTLISLINDILDFSKIESGNMEIEEKEYDLSSVVNDVVNMIEIKARQKNLRLITDIDSTTPEHLFGDETRVRQIILNILNNAIKYTSVGSVSLQITYDKISEDSIRLIATIRDTGVGIREDDLNKLFDKFQRLDMNRNRTIEGSGLGLAIVHQLLNLMNGNISVSSIYGKGSVFTVSIPQINRDTVVIGDYRDRYKIQAAQEKGYRESFHAPSARILVVDDTPVNLVVVKELLKKTHIQVDTAESGMECLQMSKQNLYDLILLDYRMPEMDGIETLHAFRELPNSLNAGIPVIVLTANAISGAKERFIAEGFNDYITKPIDGTQLEELLLHYLPPEKIQSS